VHEDVARIRQSAVSAKGRSEIILSPPNYYVSKVDPTPVSFNSRKEVYLSSESGTNGLRSVEGGAQACKSLDLKAQQRECRCEVMLYVDAAGRLRLDRTPNCNHTEGSRHDIYQFLGSSQKCSLRDTYLVGKLR
jgi:hypothetical protein